MNQRFSGKVVLVVGAGSSGPGWGNGKAAAVTYARNGGTVIAADARADAAEEQGRSAHLVGRDDHTLGCGQAVDELEICAWSPFIEEPVTLTEYERVHEQHQSVDQLRRQQ